MGRQRVTSIELAVLAVAFHLPYLEGEGAERVGQCVFIEDVVESHMRGWTPRATGALATLHTKGLLTLEGSPEEQLAKITQAGYEELASRGLCASLCGLSEPVPRHLVAHVLDLTGGRASVAA